MAHLDPLSSLVTALKRHQIVPDIIPQGFSPSVLLNIVYPNGKEALFGNELTVADTAEEPEVNFVPMDMPLEDAVSTGEGGALVLRSRTRC